MQKETRFDVALFLAVAFGFAYSVWVAAYLLYKVFHAISLTGFLLSTVIPMLGPALGVLAVKVLGRRAPGRIGTHQTVSPEAKAPAGRPTRLALAALYSALGVASAASVLLLSGVAAVALLARSYGKPIDWSQFPSFVIAWAACLLVWVPLVFLEEIGWRYYLFNEWKDRGFLLAGPILGLIWAVWHLPTFFFYGSFWFNLTCYLLFVPALHSLQAWAYLKGRSLLVPILIHATYNAFATAIGVSRFIYSGHQPYEMSIPDMVTKMSSNVLFCLGLLPFAFLLARELRRADSVVIQEVARSTEGVVSR